MGASRARQSRVDACLRAFVRHDAGDPRDSNYLFASHYFMTRDINERSIVNERTKSFSFGAVVLLTRTTRTRNEKPKETKENFAPGANNVEWRPDHGALMMLGARERFLSWVEVPGRNACIQVHDRPQIWLEPRRRRDIDATRCHGFPRHLARDRT